MFSPDQYELIDFGEGRRLERFGQLVIDRPCPAVNGMARAVPDAWATAAARFIRAQDGSSRWEADNDAPDRWTVQWEDNDNRGNNHWESDALAEPAPADERPAASDSPADQMPSPRSLVFELKRTPQGQVGLFPEQATNWQWLRHASRAVDDRPPRLLNLFAYTGGSTLAAAVAGAEVIHVDAAKNVVAWARRNAELSGLAEAPIRWITEDAPKFVRRELRRGQTYDGMILDPPSYGHGRRGEVWRLSKHLPNLLRQCVELTSGPRRLLLLTCHTPGYEAPRLRTLLADALRDADNARGAENRPRIDGGELTIATGAGRRMPSGHWATVGE